MLSHPPQLIVRGLQVTAFSKETGKVLIDAVRAPEERGWKTGHDESCPLLAFLLKDRLKASERNRLGTSIINLFVLDTAPECKEFEHERFAKCRLNAHATNRK